MRILIFSDLHANLEALEALQRAESRPDRVLFLGDAVGYGPDPARCVLWLKVNATVAVQGDHDRAAATGGDCASPPAWLELDRASQDATRRLLPADALSYLRGLPETARVEIEGTRFSLVHCIPGLEAGSLAGDSLLSEAGALAKAEVVLFGHTHIPLLRRVGRTWFVNPGSLGQPRHGLPSATYAVWENGELAIRHIDYDPRPTAQKLALWPLDPEHALALKQTLLEGL